LLLQPDFFFGDVGELVDRRYPAAAGVIAIGKLVVSFGHGRPVLLLSWFPIRPVASPSDKPDCHVEHRRLAGADV
jgi:hypothetical protein